MSESERQAVSEMGDGTLLAVRQMMDASRQSEESGRRPAKSRRQATEPDDRRAPMPQAFAAAERSAATDAVQGKRAAGKGFLSGLLADFEPTKKQAGFVSFVAVMLWHPWLIPGLMFLTFWLAVIVYFTMGPDRVAEVTAQGWEVFSRRRPERAARILTRVQGWADRIEGVLAKLPATWTEGVYLPDLGRSRSSGDAIADRADPFERLAREREAVLGQGRQIGL